MLCGRFLLSNDTLTFSETHRICAEHPAFADVRYWLMPLLGSTGEWPEVNDLNIVSKKLNPEFPWEFIVQEKVSRRARARGMGSLSGYLDLVIKHGKIPVRTRNVHDLLNSLSFLMFPRSKLALNLRHHKESPDGLKPGQNRTRTQDHLTIFDEGGVIRLRSPLGLSSTGRSDGLGDHIAEKDFIFGHAVYEHIVNGKSLRAARLDLDVSSPKCLTRHLSTTGTGIEARTFDDLFGSDIVQLTRLADDALAKCLQNEQKFLASEEFSHLWINP
jgi:Protein of unknown function (DUF3025)